jgi:2-polyprenyl-3-methyl-5-hydroxy-6-metoxy-1,4-benzoquinol methylase
MTSLISGAQESIFQRTKPKDFRDRIRGGVAKAITTFMAGKPKMETVVCPFCQSGESIPAFSIDGFLYRRCSACHSIYSSPRPTREELLRFYDLQPAELADSELLPEVRQRRIDIVMQPRWAVLEARLRAQGVVFPVARIMEVGAGIGHFIEVMQAAEAACHYVAVEPAKACEDRLSRLSDTTVITTILEQVPESVGSDCDLLFMNSVIEHPHFLDDFFGSARRMLKPGGVISLVDMHSGGLDLEVLRGGAQNVNPLLILQVGSIEGVRRLAQRNGLTMIDAFAMGQMDVDILHEFAQGVPEDHSLRGFAYLLADGALRADLQEVFRRHNATGYMGYLLRRPE